MNNQPQSTLNYDEVRQKIQNLDGLPPFPAIATQILTECQKPEVDTQTVTQLVDCEPAICAKVLQLANSPMFGASRPIVSISHAIVLLGFKTVSQMAISIAAGSVFDGGDPEIAKHRKQTFRQSLACAITSRVLADQLGSANPDEAYLSGVMHDVGKLVFFDAAPVPFCEMLERETTGNTTSLELEAFGVDHASVGKQCGAKWGLPPSINTAIELHHKGPDEIPDSLSMAVMIGNYFSQRWDIAANPNVTQPVSIAIEEMFSAEQLADAQATCVDQFEAVIEICEA